MVVKGKTLHTSGVHSILLVQLGDIGDVVYSFPCAKALKEAFPAANIAIAVRKKAGGLVEDCPWVDDIIAVDTQKRNLREALTYQKDFWRKVRRFGFDLAVDLRTGTRGAILTFLSGAKQRVGRYASDGKLWRNRVFTHLVLPEAKENQFIAEYYLDILSEYGISTDNLNPEIQVAPAKSTQIAELLRAENVPSDKPMIAVQPFSLWAYKEWGIAKYVEVIKRLAKRLPVSVIITGAPDERTKAEELVRQCGDVVFNFAGKTPLNLLPALLEKCGVFLGVDSAGVHIAAAVGTPTISLYGPSSPETWAPKGEDHVVVRRDFSCVPCKEMGCQGSRKSRCLDELTVDDVWSVVESRLETIGMI